MEHFYIPYIGNSPAAMSINGHQVVIVSTDREQLEDGLELIGAEAIHEVSEDDFTNPEEVINSLSEATKAMVLISPEEISLDVLLTGLKSSLPWPQ